MGRRLSAALAALVLLGALPAVAVPALAANPNTARHDAIVAHWTAERLASAKPRDFVIGKRHAKTPKAKPGGSTSVTGASWTNRGAILHASGKVFFDMAGSSWVCSGTAATDSRTGYSLVLTAGHCAYDEDNGAFATNWMFIPEFDSAPTFTCASTTWGCWTAQALVVHDGFASAGSFNTQATTHDFAFAVVGGGGKGGTQLDATVGSLGVSFSSVASGSVLDAFGYPAAGKYHGNDLTYCQGPISPDSLNQNLTWGMSCDMTGGASGGPWLSNFNTASGSGALSSLNSYGYSGIKSMYGPKFNADTQAVYAAADGATSNTIVH
jgi:V8-like Glu-specific endopeptidase